MKSVHNLGGDTSAIFSIMKVHIKNKLPNLISSFFENIQRKCEIKNIAELLNPI